MNASHSLRPRWLVIGTIVLLTASAAGASPSGTAVIDGRQWALGTSGENLPWVEADAYCRELRLDGHDDWRLPSLDELATLQDPEAATGITAPIDIDTCCLWSSTSITERPAEDGGRPGAAPAHYFWGIVFDGGIRYYSNRMFADGQALCTRDGA